MEDRKNFSETLKELEALVGPSSGDQIREELATYYEVNKTGPFQFEIDPRISDDLKQSKAHSIDIEHEATPGVKGVLFRSLAAIDNKIRNQKSFGPHSNGNYTKVVAQGDSWFAFPFVEPMDVSECLASQMPVYSLGCPGDDLTDISSGQKLQDLISALQETKAEIVALSAGGNELIGDDFPSVLTTSGNPKKAADFILTDQLQAKIDVVTKAFETIIHELTAVNPDVQICAHSYDYPLPQQHKATFLGPVMGELKIPDKYWIGICAYIIDRFDDALVLLSQKFPRNFFRVDLRGIARDLSANWADEIHLNSETAMLAASEFIVQFRNRLGTEFKLPSD